MTLRALVRSPLPLMFRDVDMMGQGNPDDHATIYNHPAALLRMRSDAPAVR